MVNLLDSLIKRFGPGMPRKNRDRVIRFVLAGRMDFYRKFLERMKQAGTNDVWGLIIDVTKIDVRDMAAFIGEVSRFTDWCKKRRIPSALFIDSEQAMSLDGKGWGRLVRGFEIKNITIDLRNPTGRRKDIGDLKEWISKMNGFLIRGKRLTAHMNTFYRQNSYMATLLINDDADNNARARERMKEIWKLGVEKIRIVMGEDACSETEGGRVIRRMLEKMGKTIVDDGYDASNRAELLEMDDAAAS